MSNEFSNHLIVSSAATAASTKLYKKSKEEGLTELEKEEQQILRRRYIDSYKANLRAQLEGVELKNKKK